MEYLVLDKQRKSSSKNSLGYIPSVQSIELKAKRVFINVSAFTACKSQEVMSPESNNPRSCVQSVE